MKTNDSLDFVRYFDATPASGVTETMKIRSEARLDQLHAMPAAPNNQKRMAKPKLTARQLAFRFTAIPVTAAAIIAGSVLIPQNHPGAPQPAFASWTAKTAPVSPHLLGPMSDACLFQLNELVKGDPAMPTELQRPALSAPMAGPPILSEQRGDWVLLGFLSADVIPQDWMRPQAVAGEDSVFGECLARMAGDTVQVELASLVGNGPSRSFNPQPWSEYQHFGLNAPIPADGVGPSFRLAEVEIPGEGVLMVFSAPVGDQVTGIELNLFDGQSVEATVAGGRLVAWWPISDTDPGVYSVDGWRTLRNTIPTITVAASGEPTRVIRTEDAASGFGSMGFRATGIGGLFDPNNPYCREVPASEDTRDPNHPRGWFDCPMPGDPNWSASQRWLHRFATPN